MGAYCDRIRAELAAGGLCSSDSGAAASAAGLILELVDELLELLDLCALHLLLVGHVAPVALLDHRLLGVLDRLVGADAHRLQAATRHLTERVRLLLELELGARRLLALRHLLALVLADEIGRHELLAARHPHLHRPLGQHDALGVQPLTVLVVVEHLLHLGACWTRRRRTPSTTTTGRCRRLTIAIYR